MHWYLKRLAAFGDTVAVAQDDDSFTYTDLVHHVEDWSVRLEASQVPPRAVVAFDGDYSIASCALLLALIARRNVAVPLANLGEERRRHAVEQACAQWVVGTERGAIERTGDAGDGDGSGHPLLDELRRLDAPGLVVFSSGSSGKTKAVLMDLNRVLEKYRRSAAAQTMLTFLLIDHFGGINTLFAGLASGGTVVPLRARDPKSVAVAIERHRVQVLPATPTFLRMLLISDVRSDHDLSSLELITYGTEPMPPATLRELSKAFPDVRLKQTYGLSELGVFRTSSRDRDSLWMKVGGEGVAWKVVDGTLRMKTGWAMLGYLDAPSPFDEDGWYDTGDCVEVDGDYLLIKGRRTEVINVGGEKVFPAEVEDVILELPQVVEATVVGRRNAVLGQVVSATVTPRGEVDAEQLRETIREHCLSRLPPAKVPMVIELSAAQHHGDRFKKVRDADGRAS